MNQQIVIYVFARVMLALAKLTVQPRGDNALVGSHYGGHGGAGVMGLSPEQVKAVQKYSWPVFASLSWAGVMWLFEGYPDTLQPSLRSSMTYMYVGRTFLVVVVLFFVWGFVFCSVAERFTRAPVVFVDPPPLSRIAMLLTQVADENILPFSVDMRTRKNGTARGISFGITSKVCFVAGNFVQTTHEICIAKWRPGIVDMTAGASRMPDRQHEHRHENGMNVLFLLLTALALNSPATARVTQGQISLTRAFLLSQFCQLRALAFPRQLHLAVLTPCVAGPGWSQHVRESNEHCCGQIWQEASDEKEA